MKNTAHSHNKLISAFSDADKKLPLSKSTDINILLNRIKLKKKVSLEIKYTFQLLFLQV
tara:strand:+ start:1288 stop:1464 length:177 start_codon:yes stop_codon:yes gene_type:complete